MFRFGNKKEGAAVRVVRERLGHSLTEAAFHAKLSANYLREIESGLRPLTDSALVKICRGWGVPFDSFETQSRGKRNGRTEAHAARKAAAAS